MKKYVIFAFVLLVVSNVYAQNRTRIAILDFRPGVGVDESLTDGISEMLISSLFDTGRFTIVERTQINAAIREQGFQRANITTGQIAEVGRILGVEYVLVGIVNFIVTERTLEQAQVGMARGEYNIDVRIVNVQSGEVVSAAGVGVRGNETIRGIMPNLARDLVARISPDNTNVVVLFGFLYVFPEDLGVLTHSQALTTIANINAVNLHGHNDWRLPTENELRIIHQNRTVLNGLMLGPAGGNSISYLSSEISSSHRRITVGFTTTWASSSSLANNDTSSARVRPVRTR